MFKSFCLHKSSIILISSIIAIFEYIFVMSNETNFNFLSNDVTKIVGQLNGVLTVECLW